MSNPPEAPRADLTNWRTAPFSRWAFQHVPAIIPTLEVAAPDAAWPLASNPHPLDSFRVKAVGGESIDLPGFLEATSTDGLVVLRDGAIVYETYANGMSRQTRHILMSATKSVTGLVAGMLQNLGVISLGGLVTDYLPEMVDGPYEGAILQHLLDMRTGVTLDPEQQAAYNAATGWDPTPVGQTADLHHFFETLRGTSKPHGGPFSYVSANTDLLGWVLERASGQSFAELVSELLWRPTGAEASAHMTVDGKGAARCTGGLCATVRDFARIGRLLVEDGVVDGARIVPRGWFEDTTDNGERDAWRRGEFARGFGGAEMRYRNGWYVVDDDPKIIFAMGIHGQNLFVDRANRLVVAKVSSLNTPIDFRAVALTHAAVAEFRRLLTGA